MTERDARFLVQHLNHNNVRPLLDRGTLYVQEYTGLPKWTAVFNQTDNRWEARAA